METEKKEKVIDLMDLLYRFRRYWIVIVICGVLAATGAFLYTKLGITPLYEASCRLIVITREEIGDNVTQDQLNSGESIIATYKEIILGRGFLEHVRTKLGYKESELSYLSLRGTLTVSSVSGTQIMSVSVRDPDIKRASRIASVIYAEAPAYIKDKAKIGSCEQLEPVVETVGSVYPSWKRNTALGLLIGLLLPMAVITLKMVFENTYKTDADVKMDLDLPVLGVIPAMDFSRVTEDKDKKEKGRN